MKSLRNLPEIIRGSNLPLPVVIGKKIVAIDKRGWVSVSLVWFKSSGTSDVSIVVEVVIIKGSRWGKSHVIVSWVGILSFTFWLWIFFGSTEASLAGGDNRSLKHGSS
jgi:hypothetical protein